VILFVSSEVGGLVIPKVSVIIPTKNGGTQLREVVEQVLNQKTLFSFDLTIIDSGSSDGVIQDLSKMGRSEIKIISIEPEEFGHGRTRNQAIALTQGEYIAVITQDATPSSTTWLQNLVNIIEIDPKIAGVFGRHLPYPDADIFTQRDFQMHFDSFRAEPVVCLADQEKYKADEHYRQKLHFFSDNNALLRRSVWMRIPYPDVSYAEDQQWAKLIIEAGWKKGYSDEGAVYHSHNYTFFDLFRRAIDESKAMQKYFDYKLSPTLRSVLKSWLGLSFMDTKYVLSLKKRLRTNIVALFSQYLKNLLKPLGHHIGSKGLELPEFLMRFFSYDYRLRVGKRKGGTVAPIK